MAKKSSKSKLDSEDSEEDSPKVSMRRRAPKKVETSSEEDSPKVSMRRRVSKKVETSSEDDSPKARKVVKKAVKKTTKPKHSAPKKKPAKVDSDVDLSEEEDVVLKKPKRSAKRKQTVKFEDSDDETNGRQSERILEVGTIHTTAIKDLLERLDAYNSECCIIFIRPDPSADPPEPGGIRITHVSEYETILARIVLYAKKFEPFFCADAKFTAGLDLKEANILLKHISNNDSILMYVDKSNPNILHVQSDSSKDKKGESDSTDVELHLIETQYVDHPVPRTEFTNLVQMPVSMFSTICKNMSNCTIYVEIKSIGDQITFTGISEGNSRVTKTFKTQSVDKNCKIKNRSIFQGVFNTKELLIMSKCNRLCENIQFYLKNEFPLVLLIHIASLGRMYVFLTPKAEDAE